MIPARVRFRDFEVSEGDAARAGDVGSFFVDEVVPIVGTDFEVG